MPTWKFSGPPAPVRMMAGRATEPSSALPTRLNCCCKTVDLNRGEIPGQWMPMAAAPGSVGARPPKDWQLFLQICCAASLAGTCSPLNFCLAANLLLGNLLLWRHRVFQHGGFLIPLQSKVVFALFLWRERENVSASTYLPAFPSSCSPGTVPGPHGPPACSPFSPAAPCANGCLEAAGRGTLHPSPEKSRLPVPFSAQPHLFEDDVNVAGNQLGNLLPLCCLHRVVTILVISKILQWQGTG